MKNSTKIILIQLSEEILSFYFLMKETASGSSMCVCVCPYLFIRILHLNQFSRQQLQETPISQDLILFLFNATFTHKYQGLLRKYDANKGLFILTSS